MRQLTLYFLILALGTVACTEPTVPAVPHRAPTVVRTVTPPAICEKNWLYVRDGNWHDIYNWLPSGAPSSSDEVCISGAGTYTITLDAGAVADSIYVGPGVNVTFVSTANFPNNFSLVVDEEVVVAAGAVVTVRDNARIVTDDLINDGSSSVRDNGALSTYNVLENRGLFELSDADGIVIEDLIHTGDLRVEADELIDCLGRCEFAGGRVLGPGTLTLDSPWYDNEFDDEEGYVVWSGGQFGLRGAATNAAQVRLRSLTLFLDNTGLSGSVDMFSITDTLIGPIGPSVDVNVEHSSFGVLRLSLPTGTPGAFINEGSLRFVGTPPVTVEGSRALENRGTLEALGSRTHLMMPSVDNWGVIELESELSFGLSPSSTTMRNFGSINVNANGTLALYGGSYQNVGNGAQTGKFWLEGGTLTGGGRVGHVVAVGGTIDPGPGLGTLSIDRLKLMPASRVRMEVANASTMDRIEVRGEATYDGILEVRSLGSYIGGVCGQVLPMFTDRNRTTNHAPGAFATFENQPGGLGRYWRAHYGRDTVFAVGYDPTVAIGGTIASAPFTEGGASVNGTVCIGLPVTGSDVTASMSAVRGQFSVTTPAPFVFTATDFTLPRTVSYMAVDDVVSEGPHLDTVSFRLTQGGAAFGPPARGIPVLLADNDPAVDLTVSMLSANNPVTVNQVLERHFRVTNVGPGASTGSTLTIPALTGVTFLSAGAGVTCGMTAGKLSCTVGALATGASIDVLLLFTAPATPGVFNNTLRIKGNDWDNVASNDSFVWTLTVN